jgi:hypothetical protein
MGLHGLLMGEIDLILYDMYIYFFVHGWFYGAFNSRAHTLTRLIEL